MRRAHAPHAHLTTPLVAAVAAAMLLAGCGGDESTETASPAAPSSSSAAMEESSAPSEPASSPAPEPKGVVVDVTVSGESIDPNGERVQAELGEPLILRIDSDRAGELHVHSTPEQEVEFGKGSTQIELSFDQPGVVEVEDHESGLVVLQVQVS